MKYEYQQKLGNTSTLLENELEKMNRIIQEYNDKYSSIINDPRYKLRNQALFIVSKDIKKLVKELNTKINLLFINSGKNKRPEPNKKDTFEEDFPSENEAIK